MVEGVQQGPVLVGTFFSVSFFFRSFFAVPVCDSDSSGSWSVSTSSSPVFLAGFAILQ